MSKLKPMLAETCEDISTLIYPVIASPKLDGIRCLIVNGKAVSRTLKPIRNKHVQEWVAKNAAVLEGLDGELISGEHDAEVFNRTTSVIMSGDGGPEFMFWCFDRVSTDKYLARLRSIRPPAGFYLPNYRVVPSKTCNNPDELRAFEEECLARGFEGCMVRKPDGPYKYGRSTLKEGYLLKIKRFADSEATVIGWGERMHNENPEERDATGKMDRSTSKAGMRGAGDLGYLLVRGSDGRHFNIGSGFTAVQRKELWANQKQLMNKIVRYKHFEQGVKDAPRFPTFIGFRDPEDMS